MTDFNNKNKSAGLLNMKMGGSYSRVATFRCSEDVREDL